MAGPALFTVHVECNCPCQCTFPVVWDDKATEYKLTGTSYAADAVPIGYIPSIINDICEWSNRGGKVKNILVKRV